MWWDGSGDHMGDGWWFVMGFGMLVFWGLLAVLVYVLVRGTSGGWAVPGQPGQQRQVAPPARRHDPREVLEQRLASGDIEVDEFRRRMDALDGA